MRPGNIKARLSVTSQSFLSNDEELQRFFKFVPLPALGTLLEPSWNLLQKLHSKRKKHETAQASRYALVSVLMLGLKLS
jgi:hypothetical protein